MSLVFVFPLLFQTLVMKFATENGKEEFDKIKKVNEALLARNIPELRRLATTHGGLLIDGLRSRVWPVLACQDKSLEGKHSRSVERKSLQIYDFIEYIQ